MRKITLGFLLVALWASYADAADGGVMSSRIMAATGGTDADAARTSPRNGEKSGTTNNDARSTVRNRTNLPQTQQNNDATTTVVRSGNRVINIDTPAQKLTRTATSGNVATRATRNRAAGTTKTAAEKLSDAVNRVGQSARTSATSINAKPAIRRAGLTLRPTLADVGGRAKIAGTDLYTGSNIDDEIRTVTARASDSVTPTTESIAAAKDRLEKTAELNKSCQEQYNECMDQFCAVIDANQKRCSCSANLKKYEEVEAAVKDANNQLNDVAQRIRYIGLSADEIRAIMNETEAEAVLSSNEDKTETRDMLAEIEELIQDPTKASNYTSTENAFSGLDMDIDFSGNIDDLFSLDFFNQSSGDNLSSMRGTQLYNAAKKRCATVLEQCTDAGATTNQITGNYDLAIDKDCIAYETGLRKMNNTLKSNVRSANNMLQKARLAVLQDKNKYDAKACVSALETCMTDEMVCGEGYTKCVDPTKRYIDENGEVVLGQDIGKIIDFMNEYNNGNITSTWLKDAYSMTITPENCSDTENKTNDGSCVAAHLLKKIGTKQSVTEEGLCRAVLDKCQAYTYNDGDYIPYNDVIVHYTQRAMVNIKAAQSVIISDYASSCLKDISACYNQQSSQVNSWSTSANVESVYRVMRGACRNVALTCAYAVFHEDTEHCPWVMDAKSDPQPAEPKQKNADKCIENISEVFYQSLLCPDNSTYVPNSTAKNADPNESTQTTDNDGDTSGGMVNSHCRCNIGYVTYNGACVTPCQDGYIHTDSHSCNACATGYTKDTEGKCVAQSEQQ